MTSYDKEIDRLQGLVLDALRQHTLPEAVAQQLVHASFPDAVVSVSPPAFKPLPAAQQEQLTNALHAAAAQLLADAKAAGQQVMQYKLEPGREQAAVAELLDAVLWLAPQTPSPLDIGLPAQLLEQITEGASVQECEGVFVYLDSRTATFKSPAFAEMRCKNTLLRTCNMLLKRLSKSANAMLCGRILLFLAKLLPLTERSGVNLGGSFNTDNATPVEDVQEGALDSEGKPVDAAFYRTFWGLQTFFSNPQVALQPGKWGEVSRDIKRVLDKFRLEKVTVGESAAVASDGGDEGRGASVKYLSSSRLINLQLRDATFRRHFLLQCLVLMQWCERPRQKDKAGLRAKLLEDMQELRARVYASLESTPDKGPQFAAAIRHLMQWEDSWAAWKQSTCPAAPLQRPPAEPPAGAESADLTAPAPKRRKLSSDAIFGMRVGTEELDRLWNLTEDNLSALSADDRGGFKTCRQLMEPVIEEMRAAAEGEDDGLLMKASRSKLYSWKALRAVSRTNLQAFAAAVQREGDLQVAARVLYPSECPPLPAAQPPTAVPAAKQAGAGDSAARSASTSLGDPAPMTPASSLLLSGGGGAAAAAGGEDGAGGGSGDVPAADDAEEEEEEGELPDEAEEGEEEEEEEGEEGDGEGSEGAAGAAMATDAAAPIPPSQ
ncbi:hypothetical protein D9Q98_010579 [Chlorella vulgaris]|uniref:THO complex subunit 1 n=1 Tax=Chlorella vulgaris TaxID=3077 RepID=A0A9D4TQQ7_CHLVU|nr:hypothetical protein D9Q98_010579 [Chlorella vulgaris]